MGYDRKEFSALPGKHLFHDDIFSKVFDKLENNLATQVLVGDLPAVKHDLNFYLVSFS